MSAEVEAKLRQKIVEQQQTIDHINNILAQLYLLNMQTLI